MMKCLILSVLTLLISSNVQSQDRRNFGLTFKSGISEFHSVSSEDAIFRPNLITTSPSFSWGIFADGEKQLSKFISIQSQIGYNNIRGNEIETYSAINVDNGEEVEFRSETERNAHYVSLLSFVNFHPSAKFIIGMGFSFNYRISNSYESHGYSNNMPSYVIGGGNDLQNFDLALNPQIGYKIADRINIYAAAQFGLFNIRDENIKDSYSREFGIDSGNNFMLKSRQYTIGLKYSFYKGKA